MSKRPYVQKRRADQRAETRQRIIESTVALHQEVGPAATQVSQIARRAGIQRATFYNHFPEEAALFAACSAHWRGLHPMPDPQRWSSTADPIQRACQILRDLYGWFRETRSMTGNVLRDAQSIPALGELVNAGLVRALERAADSAAEAFAASGDRKQRVDLSARAAVSFSFWQVLEPLGDEAAARLGAGLIAVAAD